jgi:hypothetical protein
MAELAAAPNEETRFPLPKQEDKIRISFPFCNTRFNFPNSASRTTFSLVTSTRSKVVQKSQVEFYQCATVYFKFNDEGQD